MDARLDYPATGRNREPIRDVLREWLPPSGLVLEIASGSGQHHAWFAQDFPELTWQPSDREARARDSIRAWGAPLPNTRPPLALDVLEPWPIDAADVVMCVNMVHISPWACTLALLEGARRILPEGGLLYLYGPYRVGAWMAPSNVGFDASLRSRDPSWGVRDLEAVVEAAAPLVHEATVQMPANNLSVLFRKPVTR